MIPLVPFGLSGFEKTVRYFSKGPPVGLSDGSQITQNFVRNTGLRIRGEFLRT
jgi:hypothetical protein